MEWDPWTGDYGSYSGDGSGTGTIRIGKVAGTSNGTSMAIVNGVVELYGGGTGIDSVGQTI